MENKCVYKFNCYATCNVERLCFLQFTMLSRIRSASKYPSRKSRLFAHSKLARWSPIFRRGWQTDGSKGFSRQTPDISPVASGAARRGALKDRRVGVGKKCYDANNVETSNELYSEPSPLCQRARLKIRIRLPRYRMARRGVETRARAVAKRWVGRNLKDQYPFPQASFASKKGDKFTGFQTWYIKCVEYELNESSRC